MIRDIRGKTICAIREICGKIIREIRAIRGKTICAIREICGEKLYIRGEIIRVIREIRGKENLCNPPELAEPVPFVS